MLLTRSTLTFVLTFRPADAETQASIDRTIEMSSKKLRSLFGAGASATGDVFSSLTSTRMNRSIPDDDPLPRPRWADGSTRVWSGSAKLTFADADVLGRNSGITISAGSLPVTIGGSDTAVTGNLELFEDSLLFVPHDSWRRRDVEVMRVDTNEPILVSGILAGQQGPRALVVTLRPSQSRVTFRLGLALKGLDDIVAASTAP